MSDIALVWDGAGADVALQGGLLQVDSGLRTAIILSLFIDRRANDDDVIPDGTNNKRGFYASPNSGSRLWLLEREKNLQSVINRAREYCREALQWLIDDGVATGIDIDVESQHQTRLAIRVNIHRPSGDDINFRFQQLWNAEAA